MSTDYGLELADNKALPEPVLTKNSIAYGVPRPQWVSSNVATRPYFFLILKKYFNVIYMHKLPIFGH